MTHVPYSLWPDPRANSSDKSRDEIQRLRLVRQGHRDTIISALEARFIASDILQGGSSRTQITSRRNWILANEIGPLIDTRINEMPQSWRFGPQDPEDPTSVAFADELNEWAESPATEDGIDLFSATGELVDDQEADGNAAIVLGRHPDGAVWFALRDTAQVRVDVDREQPRKIAAVSFEWKADGAAGEQPRTYREEITAEGRVLYIDGKRDAEGYASYGIPCLPVVLIPRRVRKGSPLGDSGVAELEEAQLAYLWALHLLNKANKYEAGGVYCPEPGDDDGALLPDQDGGRVTNIPIEPGMLYPIPIRKVGGSINTQTLQAQAEMALQSLRRQAKVRENGDQTADGRSGRAMMIGSDAMQNYVRRKMLLVRLGLVHLATIWGHLTGRLADHDTAPVTVEFDQADDGDQQELTKRAEFWLKARTAGEITAARFYRELQRLGLIDEAEDTDAMADEIEEEREAEAERTATAFVNAAPAPSPAPMPVSEADDMDEMMGEME